MSEKNSRFQRKKLTRKRRIQKGGIGLTLPFFQYIPIDPSILNFERVLCTIQSTDIHTDLLTLCGLDTKDQVWFGFQRMDSSFYQTYMNKIGYENDDKIILRNYTIDGFSQKGTKIQEITNTDITINMIHDIWNMMIQSELNVPWKMIYHGKELYQMMTTQLLDSPVSSISNNTKFIPKSNTNSLKKMVFPDWRKKEDALKKRQKKSDSTSISTNEEDDLRNVHGIGDKTVEMLHNKNIYTIRQLRHALTSHPTLLNQAQIIGLQYYEDLKQPIPREEIKTYETHLRNITSKLNPEMNMTIAGSYRRNKPTSHDIDVLFTYPENTNLNVEGWLDTFVDAMIEENIHLVYLTRSSIKFMAIIRMPDMRLHRRIDFMLVPISRYPFALLYLTGSKDFTMNMRKIAIQKGYSLSENGFKDLKTNERVNVNDFKSEKDIFDFLDMDYLAPEYRVH
jgi:DNA polymerase/3'-5' exonuclease PolX